MFMFDICMSLYMSSSGETLVLLPNICFNNMCTYIFNINK